MIFEVWMRAPPTIILFGERNGQILLPQLEENLAHWIVIALLLAGSTGLLRAQVSTVDTQMKTFKLAKLVSCPWRASTAHDASDTVSGPSDILYTITSQVNMAARRASRDAAGFEICMGKRNQHTLNYFWQPYLDNFWNPFWFFPFEALKSANYFILLLGNYGLLWHFWFISRARCCTVEYLVAGWMP